MSRSVYAEVTRLCARFSRFEKKKKKKKHRKEKREKQREYFARISRNKKISFYAAGIVNEKNIQQEIIE